MSWKICLSIVSVLFVGAAIADDGPIPIGDNQACLEGPLAEFGQYLGNWDIADSRLGQDGTWSPGAGAKWNFVCLGDGTAIQDFWMPTDGAVGTNLRIYNETTESWDIAWAIKGLPGFAHIEAKREPSGNIVMHYKTQIPNPLRKISFFPATSTGWNWKLEISSDNGENWLEVYRIQASRSP